MKLTTVQNKIIHSKPFGLNIVKGLSGSGKTTTAAYRVLFLKNNYCLYEEDGILVVGCDENNVGYIRDFYSRIEEESRFDYFTLFSSEKDKTHITSIGAIVHNYFIEYMKSKKVEFTLIDDEERKRIMLSCIEEIKLGVKKMKILTESYLKFFIEEISWIKACNYSSLEEYQNCDRIGRKYAKGEGPQRLLKNSKERKAVYDLLFSYNRKLKEKGLVDREDTVTLALEQVRKKCTKKYAHVIIDECEKLTKTQLELVMTLSSERVYSSTMMLLQKDYNCSTDFNPWFVKGRKYNTLVDTGIQGKTYWLKGSFIEAEEAVKMPAADFKENEVEHEGASKMENSAIEESSMENYQYHDIRHYRKYEFLRDPDKIDELIVRSGEADEEYQKDYLKELPVYSDIAAGEPILMSSELEANFYLPQSWLRGINECFILKVKGDSMINAEINDGDFVVIRRQHNAQNHDIVAVDLEGSATLKRLSLGKGGATLMPENPKYNPIPLYGREATILGIAVGVIKNAG